MRIIRHNFFYDAVNDVPLLQMSKAIIWRKYASESKLELFFLLTTTYCKRKYVNFKYFKYIYFFNTKHD